MISRLVPDIFHRNQTFDDCNIPSDLNQTLVVYSECVEEVLNSAHTGKLILFMGGAERGHDTPYYDHPRVVHVLSSNEMKFQ